MAGCLGGLPAFLVNSAAGNSPFLPGRRAQERAEEQAAAGSEDVAAASVQSLPDTRTAKAAASSSSGQQGSVVGLGEEDASAHSGGLAPPTPSQPPGGALSAADAVAPMRDFASDVAAEVESPAVAGWMPGVAGNAQAAWPALPLNVTPKGGL